MSKALVSIKLSAVSTLCQLLFPQNEGNCIYSMVPVNLKNFSHAPLDNTHFFSQNSYCH